MPDYPPELVESVARAITRAVYSSIYGNEIRTIEVLASEHWRINVNEANAAITATLQGIREPGDGALKATGLRSPGIFLQPWQAMIDHLIKEGGK